MTDRDRILDAVAAAWLELEDALALVPKGRLDEPGAVGEWSVKDLLGHVTTWEQEAIRALRRYLDDRDTKALATWHDIDGLNARESDRKKAVSLSKLRSEFEKSHLQLLAFLSDFPEEQIGVSEVERRIIIDTYGHYAEHSTNIREWLVAATAEAPDS